MRPKCIVLKLLEQSKALTDAELQVLGTQVPLALECINCSRRKENKLEKFCIKNF